MLTRKMFRDMKNHKAQFVSIFLMAFLAIYIYAGVGAEWLGLEKHSRQFYDETNLADVWVYGDDFSAEQAEAVAEVAGISSVQRRAVIEATGKFKNKPNMTLYFMEENEISKPHILSGAPFDIDDADGIWLDKRFADAHGLGAGDTVEATFGGVTIGKEVRGLIYSAEYVYMPTDGGMTPDSAAYGYAYLSRAAFPVPELFAHTTLLLKTEASAPAELEDEVNRALNGSYGVFLEREAHPGISVFRDEIIQHRMMGDIFPVVFLLVALLTVITTMTRLTNGQRMQIGLLKAFGFKRGEILRHYVAYGFWLTAAGVLLGCVAGPLTLPRLFYPSMSSFYTLPEWGAAFAPSFVWVAAAIVALFVLMTYLACRGILSDTPARTLRPKAPKSFRHMSFEKSVLLRRLGFNARWNLRDAVRNKARSLTAIIGVLGCTALIVCALGTNDVMNDLKNWQYEDINRFESKLNLEDTATDEDIDELMRAVAGEKISENPVEIRANGVKKTGTFTVTDDVTLIKRTDRALRPIALPRDGLSITAKMADMLGVDVGDEVEWHVYGDEGWNRNTIAAVYREPTAQGISVSRAYYEAEGNVFRATSVLSAERITESFEGVAAILSTDDMISGWNDLTEAMYTLIYLLIIAAVVLAVVVLYNLGLLSFTEMERDMATLKVMGLRTKKLRELLLTQNIWFSVVGFALGVPAGLWLVGAIIATTGDGYDFPLRLHASNAALSFAITFGLSIGVSLLFSKKIRKLNMVEALKSTE